MWPNRQRPIPGRDPRVDRLQQVKRIATDLMSEVRKGRAAEWDAAERASVIRQIDVPKHGWEHRMQAAYIGNWAPRRVYRERFIADGIPSAPGLLVPEDRASLESALNTTAQLGRELTPAHTTFRKTLGYGGYGVAALFGVHDSTGREVAVVVKADIRWNTGDSIQAEKANMVLMSGAKHVVQRVLSAQIPWPDDIPEPYNYTAAAARVTFKALIFLIKVSGLSVFTLIQLLLFSIRLVINWTLSRGSVPPDRPPRPALELVSWRWSQLWPDWPAGAPTRGPGIDGAIRRSRRELDNRQDIICMEFLKFGDLSKWISKMARLNGDGRLTGHQDDDADSVTLERLAWTIFECLWRGCVALAYPKGFYQGGDPLNTQIPQVTESIERSAVDDSNPMVHFDLNPSNVFVGDFVADHVVWPLTKIGDLGVSLQPKSQRFQDRIDEEQQRWTQRMMGKFDSYLPEQTTEQWDFIPGLNVLQNHQVAGNYGVQSNLYHIGLTMFQILTLCFPDRPPFARPYDFVIDRESRSGWTYGHHLLEEYNPNITGQYSADLRHTVAWCMEHRPLERPSLARLGQIIERNLAANYPDQPADGTRTSVGNILGNPLPPRAT